MIEGFEDILVVYPSDIDPGRFVAHSLRTDQVGVGDDPIEALVEVVHAIRDLVEEASRDERVVVEQHAPEHVIQRLLDASAKKIPDVVWKQIEELTTRPADDANYWRTYRDHGEITKWFIPMSCDHRTTATAWHDLRTDDVLVQAD